MNAVRQLETRLAALYAKLPVLPLSARRWIANNSWWITLVLAIISVVTMLILLPILFTALALALGLSATYGVIYPYAGVGLVTNVISVVVSLFGAILNIALLFAAVSPLKVLRHRGWLLLFLSTILGVVLMVISFIVSVIGTDAGTVVGKIFGLIWSLILTAVELYFLFQIRSEFGAGRAVVADAKPVEAEVVEEPVVK